jgi:hypothetical protein
MSQQPDDIFRRRLEDLQTPPPAGAWSRIENGLGKRRGSLWLKVAAALALLFIASFVFWSIRENRNPEHAIVNNDRSFSQDSVRTPVDRSKTETEKSYDTRQQTTDPVLLAQQHAKPKVNAKQTTVILPQRSSDNTEEEVTDDTGTALDQAEVISEAALTPPHLPDTLQSGVASFKLVLKADEVSKKYLDKNSLADATDGKPKASGLKKLLDKANDLRNNQNPFGDLRQKKNEILALNFQGDRKHDQNK